MNKKGLFSLVFILLFISLACNFPLSLGAGRSNQGLDDLNDLLQADLDLGELSEVDANQDGSLETFIYSLPAYEVEPDVLMTKSHFVTEDSAGAASRGIKLSFVNTSTSPKEFDFPIEIPKEIVAHVDYIEFSTPPKEIINPDPSVVFGVMQDPEGAVDIIMTIADVTGVSSIYSSFDKEYLMFLASKEAKYYCENAMFPSFRDRDACYLNFAEDFQGYVTGDLLWDTCNKVTDNLTRTLCHSVNNADPISECTHESLSLGEKEICTAYIINMKCAEFSNREDQIICQAESALKHYNEITCLAIPVSEIQNDCMAKVLLDKKYCEKINDEGLKLDCLYYLLGKEGEAAEAVGGLHQLLEKLNGGRYMNAWNWFPDNTADELCRKFAPAVGLPLQDGEGWQSHLECEYSSNPDDHYPPGSVWIYAFETEQDALDKWQENIEGFEVLSTTQQVIHKEMTPDSTLIIWHREYVNEGVWYYDMDTEKLYGNTIIIYQRDRLTSDDRSSWEQVLNVAYELIDSKR